jgi:cobalt-zinc-cadmium efflux system membrane fusion protein
LLACVLCGCSKPELPAPAASPSVSGSTVSFADQKEPPGVRLARVGSDGNQTLTLPGRLSWNEDRTARVYAPFAGRIDRLRVSLGDRVRRGDVLADVTSGDIGQAQADLHKAEADLSVATAAAERARELSAGGVIAAKDWQQAQADLARSTAERERARARLAQYGVASNAITQALALTAPLGGIVVERNANPKAEVRADVQGAPLFVISDPTSLWATLDVDETLLAQLSAVHALELRAAAWPDDSFSGTISSVGESVDPVTRMVKVRLLVPNAERRLKAEMFVTAQIKRAANLPIAPADAIFVRGDQSFAFVQIAPGRYERRVVKVRDNGPQSSLVLQGLSAGEQVVVGGGLYLDQLLDAARQ